MIRGCKIGANFFRLCCRCVSCRQCPSWLFFLSRAVGQPSWAYGFFFFKCDGAPLPFVLLFVQVWAFLCCFSFLSFVYHKPFYFKNLDCLLEIESILNLVRLLLPSTTLYSHSHIPPFLTLLSFYFDFCVPFTSGIVHFFFQNFCVCVCVRAPVFFMRAQHFQSRSAKNIFSKSQIDFCHAGIIFVDFLLELSLRVYTHGIVPMFYNHDFFPTTCFVHGLIHLCASPFPFVYSSSFLCFLICVSVVTLSF